MKTSRIFIALLLITFTLGSFAHSQSRGDIEKANKLINEGNTAMSRNDFASAIASYSKALGHAPNSGAAYMNRGAAYASSGQPDLALADFEKALSLSESFAEKNVAELYYNIGNAYQGKRDFVKSIEFFTKAIELAPGVSKYYLNRGNSHKLMGKLELAMLDYDESINRSPNSLAFYNRASIALSKREYAKAIEDYTRAIELNSSFSEAFSNRGLTYLRSGSTDLAIEDFSKAIAIKPHGVYFMNRAVAYNITKDFAAAIGDSTKTIEIYPLWRVAYLQRALAYRRQGKLELSAADVKKAKEVEKEGFEPFKGANVMFVFNYSELELEKPNQ